MNRSIIFSLIAVLTGLVFIGTLVSGIEPTTFDLTIGPGDFDGGPVVFLDSDTVEMKVESDIPVDVYIISYEELMNVQSGDFDYEKKWEGETNLNVNYKVDNPDMQYYILIMNPSETETANVDLEYKLFEEAAKDIAEDAAKDACCGSTILISVVLLSMLLLLTIYIKGKN